MFGEWYQKSNKIEDTDKLTLLAFKIITVLHNTLLATSINLLETVSKGFFRNQSQNRCHTFLGCLHVCKTCAFRDAVQAGKQKEVHPPYSPDLVPAGARSGENSGLLSVFPPEEHHEMCTFCRRGGNPRTLTAVLRLIPKEASADSFKKLYACCQ
jgi:hypothetical protein